MYVVMYACLWLPLSKSEQNELLAPSPACVFSGAASVNA